MSIFATGIYEKIRKDIKEKVEVKIKNPKILEIPDNKNFYQMPLKHFISVAKRKSKGAVQKALVNLERFNKNKNPGVSKKASDIINKLKKNKEFQSIGKKKISKVLESKNINEQLNEVKETLTFEEQSELIDDIKKKFIGSEGQLKGKFGDESDEETRETLVSIIARDYEISNRLASDSIDLALEQFEEHKAAVGERKKDGSIIETLKDENIEQLVLQFNIDKGLARKILETAIDLINEQRRVDKDLDVIEELVNEFNIKIDLARDISERALDILDHEEEEEKNRAETLEREGSIIQSREVRNLIQKLNNQKIEAESVGDDIKVAILNDIINTIRRPESNEAKINEVEKGSRPIINQLDDIKQQAEKAIEGIKEFESDQTTSGSAKVERTKIRAKKEIDKVSVLVKELRTQFVLESEKTNEFLLRGKKIDFGKIDSFIKEAEELLGEAKEFSLERIDTVINPLDALVTLIKELDKDVILEQISEEAISKELSDIGFNNFNVRTLKSGSVIVVLDAFDSVKVTDFKKFENLGIEAVKSDFTGNNPNSLVLVFRKDIGEGLNKEFKSLVGYKVQVDEIIEQEAPDLKDKYTWDMDRGLRPKEGFVDDIKEILEQSKLFSEIRWNGKLEVIEMKVSEQEEKISEQRGVSIDEKDLLDDIVLVAENEGDFFRDKDPRGAVKFASKNLQREKEADLRSNLRDIENDATEQVRISWGFTKDEIKEVVKMNRDLYEKVNQSVNQTVNEQLDPVDFDKEDIMGEIGIEAQRKTEFKRAGNAVGAVEAAARELRDKILDELEGIISSVKQDAIEHVEEVWEENR